MPAVKIPRGRWYLKLRATVLTPFASSADASVSPGCPWYSRRSKRNSSTCPRSIMPPCGKRKCCVIPRRYRTSPRTGTAAIAVALPVPAGACGENEPAPTSNVAPSTAAPAIGFVVITAIPPSREAAEFSDRGAMIAKIAAILSHSRAVDDAEARSGIVRRFRGGSVFGPPASLIAGEKSLFRRGNFFTAGRNSFNYKENCDPRGAPDGNSL